MSPTDQAQTVKDRNLKTTVQWILTRVHTWVAATQTDVQTFQLIPSLSGSVLTMDKTTTLTPITTA